MKKLNEHDNYSKQGNVGLGRAIALFTRMGITVLLPLNDTQPYDLVIDFKGLKKVQVKTTCSIAPSGCYRVNLRTLGGNQSFHTAKNFDISESDYVFILTGDFKEYLVPSMEIQSVSTLSLNEDRIKYLITDDFEMV